MVVDKVLQGKKKWEEGEARSSLVVGTRAVEEEVVARRMGEDGEESESGAAGLEGADQPGMDDRTEAGGRAGYKEGTSGVVGRRDKLEVRVVGWRAGLAGKTPAEEGHTTEEEVAGAERGEAIAGDRNWGVVKNREVARIGLLLDLSCQILTFASSPWRSSGPDVEIANVLVP